MTSLDSRTQFNPPALDRAAEMQKVQISMGSTFVVVERGGDANTYLVCALWVIPCEKSEKNMTDFFLVFDLKSQKY